MLRHLQGASRAAPPPVVMLLMCALAVPAHERSDVTRKSDVHLQIVSDGTAELSRNDGVEALGTPLVLDVDGRGLAFTDVRHSTVHVDLDGDGRAERVAWVSPARARGQAFLVMDRNDNGVVDGGRELFGNQHGAAHGFVELARLDDQNDSVIDAQDRAFEKLRLWTDANANARSEADELTTLKDAGITSLPLAFTSSDERDEHGNGLFQVGRFVRADGTSGAMTDVWLKMDKREDRGALLF